MRQQIDYIDCKILQILQENARTTLKDIASQVFLSSPATSARIDKLEKEGFILGYYTKVNREKMGNHIKAFVNVEVANDKKDAFIEYITDCPNVLECSCITGEYAMLLEVVYSNTEELEQFVSKLQRYGKTQTQIVFSTAIERRELTPALSMEM